MVPVPFLNRLHFFLSNVENSIIYFFIFLFYFRIANFSSNYRITSVQQAVKTHHEIFQAMDIQYTMKNIVWRCVKWNLNEKNMLMYFNFFYVYSFLPYTYITKFFVFRSIQILYVTLFVNLFP